MISVDVVLSAQTVLNICLNEQTVQCLIKRLTSAFKFYQTAIKQGVQTGNVWSPNDVRLPNIFGLHRALNINHPALKFKRCSLTL